MSDYRPEIINGPESLRIRPEVIQSALSMLEETLKRDKGIEFTIDSQPQEHMDKMSVLNYEEMPQNRIDTPVYYNTLKQSPFSPDAENLNKMSINSSAEQPPKQLENNPLLDMARRAVEEANNYGISVKEDSNV